MAKSKRIIADNLKLVDAVCEVVDARIPLSSRNRDLDELSRDKPRMIVLNRADQADESATKAWEGYFKDNGYAVIVTDSKCGSGIDAFQGCIKKLLSEKIDRLKQKGMSGRALKVMIVGIPNVGKSSFINKVLKKKAAKAEDRPGVTRKNQWFTVGEGVEMLDTPGILPPKIDDEKTGLMLAFTGAVKDEILDLETLSSALMYELSNSAPEALKNRYGINAQELYVPEEFEMMPEPDIAYGYRLLSELAKRRGFVISGGEYDTERAANVLLDEFRSGRLGRISLERPQTLKI